MNYQRDCRIRESRSRRVGNRRGCARRVCDVQLDCHSLDAILLLLGANHHGFFSGHHVADAVSVIADSLVAVEPFDFLKMGVLLIEMIAPDAKPDGNAENGYDYGIYAHGDCRPYSTVDDAIHPFPESFRRFLQALGLTAELAVDSFIERVLDILVKPVLEYCYKSIS